MKLGNWKKITLHSNIYALINIAFSAIVLGIVMLVPAFSINTYQHIARLTESYLDHVDFIHLFTGVMVIVFLVFVLLNVVVNVLVFFKVLKPDFALISTLISAVVILVLFIASITRCSNNSVSLFVSAYLLLLWIAGYCMLGLFFSPKN